MLNMEYVFPYLAIALTAAGCARLLSIAGTMIYDSITDRMWKRETEEEDDVASS